MKNKLKDIDGLRLHCEKCLSTNIYTLMNKTLVCRRCGHRKEKKCIQKRKNLLIS